MVTVHKHSCDDPLHTGTAELMSTVDVPLGG